MLENRRLQRTIVFLFFLNFIIGLFFINEGLFHFDSVLLSRAVENTYKTGILCPALKGRYGAVIVNSFIYLPFFILGHTADFATRFSSILFHSLSIAALFLFVKELFGDYIQAFFSSLLLSFTPFYFSANTYGKEHGASIFFLLASFSFLCLGLKRKSWIFICLASFLFAFSITIRESLLATIPLFFLLYLRPEICLKPFKVIFSKDVLKPRFLFSVILPFSLVFSLALNVYLKNEIYYVFSIRDNTSNYFLGLFSPVLQLAVRDINLCIGPLVFPFFALGIIRMLREKKIFYSLFFFSWAMLISYFGNVNTYVPRYLDVVIIPIYIVASCALSGLYSKYRVFAVGAMIYFISYMFIFIYPLVEFRHKYNGEKQFALYVKEKTEDNAVVIAMDDAPFIEYYGKRKFINHPVGNALRMDDFIKKINEHLKDKIPVYLIESGFTYDPGELFKKAVFDNFKVRVVGAKLSEDYHRADIEFMVYNARLFKIEALANKGALKVNNRSIPGFRQ